MRPKNIIRTLKSNKCVIFYCVCTTMYITLHNSCKRLTSNKEAMQQKLESLTTFSFRFSHIVHV